MSGNKIYYYGQKINTVLKRRGVISEPLAWLCWAGPGFLGCEAYALVVDMNRFTGKRVELLHDSKVLADISTVLGGLKVSYTNTQGFAFVVKEERVYDLDPVDLLAALGETDCAFIVGRRSSGKTSLLQHIISQRQDRRVVVFDPKPAGENDWLKSEVYGLGANWGEIEKRLATLEEEINGRSKTGNREPLLIVADECYRTGRYVDNYVLRLADLALFGRTLGVDVIFSNHTTGVKGNALEGLSDLLDSFVEIKLFKSKDTFKATIDYGDGPIPAKHPGPFGEATPAGPELSDREKALALLVIKHNDGVFSVNRVEALVKEHLPPRYQSDFTYHKLQAKFKEWEEAGLLSPASHDGTQMIGRKATQALIHACGVVYKGGGWIRRDSV